jgi:predicted molibdopterin-dependent oxidoreductase YjgC
LKVQQYNQIWRRLVKLVSPFLEIQPSQNEGVSICFDGVHFMLPAGENLAGALLSAGIMPFRHTPASGAPRGPYCMMGACYDCLVEVDGVNRQACMLQVTEGLDIKMPSVKGTANA